MADKKPYPLRVDAVIFDKFKVVATENGRSINKEVEMLMKNAVLSYEAHHGQIPLSDQDEQDE